MTVRPAKWASADEIAAATQAYPRDVPDEQHIAKIMQMGLSRQTARLALAIMRGDSEGDVVELPDDVLKLPAATL